MSRPPDRGPRGGVGSAQRARWCTGTDRSTGCASRASTVRRRSPRLLGEQAGHWSLGAGDAVAVTRRYIDRTMVLETTHTTPTGPRSSSTRWPWASATAGTTSARTHRISCSGSVTCTAGEVDIDLEYVPRPEYGLVYPELDAVDGGLRRHERRRRPRPVVPGARDRRRFVGIGPVPPRRGRAGVLRAASRAHRRREGPGVERDRDRRRAWTTR